jgi:hypothetical protein
MRTHKQTAFWRDAPSAVLRTGSTNTRDACATRNAAGRRFYDDVLMKRDEDKIEIKVA